LLSSTKGIGQFSALAFAKHGITRLALADINFPALETSVAALRKKYPAVSVLPLELNVRDRAAVRNSIAQIVQRFGRVDVAVNNAGVGGSGKLTHELEYDEIDHILGVNLHGVYNCQKEELAVMVGQEYVNTHHQIAQETLLLMVC
jgi:NAD(P)-dependent dehydrogenase (short-subunit alcohol dehydrogenase family)